MITLLSMKKGWNGIIEVCILLGKKEYTYFLTSDFAYKKFKTTYDKGNHGKALQVLNTYNRKEMFSWGGLNDTKAIC